MKHGKYSSAKFANLVCICIICIICIFAKISAQKSKLGNSTNSRMLFLTVVKDFVRIAEIES